MTSSRSRADVAPNRMAQVRPASAAGSPAVSSSPWSTASLTSAVLWRYASGTNAGPPRATVTTGPGAVAPCAVAKDGAVAPVSSVPSA